MKIRRVLMSVSDKAELVPLARAFLEVGAEIIATGGTAKTLEEAEIPITPIEKITGLPEAFQGRMKTLSFHVCSGILYRRGDEKDEADLKKLNILPIDAVVVNFYPFEKTVEKLGGAVGYGPAELVENIDIGGPTLVRAAAKNAESVLVLTDPSQYSAVIKELKQTKSVSLETATRCARESWTKVSDYDHAIAVELGGLEKKKLRYGENPHQSASLLFDANGPLNWGTKLTNQEISYNNILDLTHAYELTSELSKSFPSYSSVVIIKHNNPCGVALISKTEKDAQLTALTRAWEGDPVSAFGGVLVFNEPLSESSAQFLSERFVELLAAPGLDEDRTQLDRVLAKRKNLKAVSVRNFNGFPKSLEIKVPGGILTQSADHAQDEQIQSVTQKKLPESQLNLALFGIQITKQLKSNAIALVREIQKGYQLVGAGQGQPNRVEALKWLAIPRANAVLKVTGGQISDLIMVSDAFFPFRDTVDEAFKEGIRTIVQPGGSIKDAESIQACNEHGITMAFTGRRHFKH